MVFAVLTLTTAATATAELAGILGRDGVSLPEIVLFGLYAVLLVWIGANFWLSAFGAVRLLSRRKVNEQRDHGVAAGERARLWGEPRIAVVIPVYNEDPGRVFDGVAAMYQSLEATGCQGAFQFFVLSDTRDPETWLAEELAWLRSCRELAAHGRLFYRRRPDNVGRKAGNIGEFCERWGRRYEYMIVLDADSLVPGSTMVEMVRRMDEDPRLGLLQAWPRPVAGTSPFARIQQFAAAVYGRVIAAGMAELLGGEGNYWGHNAIVRIQAFMQNCGLPHLPGREPLGGEILSHDFVEAALLVRGGWQVRLACDLPCSYEEGPQSLIRHLERERRWCQGNMQHARLVLACGLHPLSRVNLLTGVMAYAAGPLWLLFLAAMAAVALQQPASPVAAPGAWPWAQTALAVEPIGRAYHLLGLTAALLLGPKAFGLGLALSDRDLRSRQGGALRLVASTLLETLSSALLAPVVMLLHSRFVISILLGRSVRWDAQQRGAERVCMREALAAHGEQMLTGLVLAAAAIAFVPSLFVWLSPVIGGLLLSAALSVGTSRVSWGRATRRLGLFLIPEETDPPAILRRRSALAGARARAAAVSPCRNPVAEVVEDPLANALHLALLPATAADGGAASETALAPDRLAMLSDPETLRWLHWQAWAARASGAESGGEAA